MSNWEIKSGISFKASNKLMTDSLFNASVHSSYYSCLQYLLHLLSVRYNYDDSRIDNLNRETTVTTHKYVIGIIFKGLRQINPDYAVDFNDDIGALINGRVTADYKSKIIEQREAEELRQLAYKTLNQLKESYS